MGDSCFFSNLLLTIFLAVPDSAASFEDDLALQAHLSPSELIRYHGYPCNVSYVTTQDGYILQIIRVPHGIGTNGSTTPDQANATSRRHPVLLLSPLFTASDIHFLNFPWRSLGFLLADNGFDVWAMSSREAKPYSRHITLSQDDPKYWLWSFDEIGRYDAAATVDHVLNVTGSSKLTILAFSQGVEASLVLLSTRPEYNDKVNLLVAYGPVANITHMKPPFSLLVPLLPVLLPLVYPFTDAGFLGPSDRLHRFLTAACKIFQGQLCSLAFTLSAFASPYQFNKTRQPMYMGHIPIGTTIQNFRHYSQIYRARNFVMYDHGVLENLKKYGQATAPPYPLERINTPVALFSSRGDTVADEHDVRDLAARLGSNVVLHYVVSQRTFRHLDFATGFRANEILHYIAIETIRKYAT